MVWIEGALVGGQVRLQSRVERGDRTVWQGVDEETKHEVVVEIARADWEGDSGDLLAFHEAAEAACGLRHPTLISVLSHGLDDERRPYVVRESPPPRTLMVLIEEGALGLRRTARFVEQVLRLLDLLHAHGLAKFGVTPDLVHVDGEDAKLWLELLAHGPTSAARAARLCAPEHDAEPSVALDARCSLWEVAALAYFALSGRVPFPAEDAAERATSMRRGAFGRIALRGDGGEASRIELEAWFRRGLAVDPTERFSNAREMLEGWKSVVGALLLFVDDRDAGAVTVVPPAKDDAERGTPSPPAWQDAEPTEIFARPIIGEDITRASQASQLASLLEDSSDDETVISQRPSEDMEGIPPTKRSEPPQATPAPSEPPEAPPSDSSESRSSHPPSSHPPSSHPPSSPIISERTRAMERARASERAMVSERGLAQPSKSVPASAPPSPPAEKPTARGLSPMTVGAFVAVAVLSSAATRWWSSRDCECPAAPTATEAWPVTPNGRETERPSSGDRPAAALPTQPAPPSATAPPAPPDKPADTAAPSAADSAPRPQVEAPAPAAIWPPPAPSPRPAPIVPRPAVPASPPAPLPRPVGPNQNEAVDPYD